MPETPAYARKIEEGCRKLADVETAVGGAIVGQTPVIRRLMVALLAGGHVLVIGVPGLAKTLLVRTLAAALGWRFRRVQFTPDLMPSDILGSEILQTDPATGTRTFTFQKGPVFTNLLLADEINRTPPKTQAALLEAMQEGTVTTGGVAHALPRPFMVAATQNPIEQEGTYPLPEAQLDRFLLSQRVGYPSPEEEQEIAARTSGPETAPPTACADVSDLVGLARVLPAPPHVTACAVRIVRATRPDDPSATARVREFVRWGAGPRASQHLLLCAKAEAARCGRFAPTTGDVAAVAADVLRHRIVLRFNAAAQGVLADEVLDEITTAAARD